MDIQDRRLPLPKLPVCRYEKVFGIVSVSDNADPDPIKIGQFFAEQVNTYAQLANSVNVNTTYTLESDPDTVRSLKGAEPLFWRDENKDESPTRSRRAWEQQAYWEGKTAYQVSATLSIPEGLKTPIEIMPDLMEVIYQCYKNVGLLDNQDYQLLTMSPDWITGGSDLVKIPTGGPGSLMNQAPDNGGIEFTIDVLASIAPAAGQRRVAVVIMDTDIPGLDDKPAWTSESAKALHKNLRVKRIDPTWTIRPVSLVMPTLAGVGHERDFGSHALFIAGIIRSIAQTYNADTAVDLYLIPILNADAEGSVESMVGGLGALGTLISMLSAQNPPIPVVINFSADFPWSPEQVSNFYDERITLNQDQEAALADKLLEEDSVPPSIKKNLDEWKTQHRAKREAASHNSSLGLERPVDEVRKQAKHLTAALKEVIADMARAVDFSLRMSQIFIDLNGIERDGVNGIPLPVMIAAAGNESAWRVKHRPNDGRFAVSFPASQENIVGVGALDKMGNRASYSNEADVPSSSGFWVFGGEAADPMSDRDIPTPVVDGVISLHDASPTGWAEWSGTSFATAIFSAIVAVVLSAKIDMPLQEISSLIGGSVELPVSQNIL